MSRSGATLISDFSVHGVRPVFTTVSDSGEAQVYSDTVLHINRHPFSLQPHFITLESGHRFHRGIFTVWRVSRTKKQPSFQPAPPQVYMDTCAGHTSLYRERQMQRRKWCYVQESIWRIRNGSSRHICEHGNTRQLHLVHFLYHIQKNCNYSLFSPHWAAHFDPAMFTHVGVHTLR